MRIGIFGGTFNPIHTAHLYVAEACREAMDLDRVVFVPAAVPPHKEVEYGVSPEHRLRMVESAIKGNQYFSVSDIELRREGPSYSVNTVNILQEEYGDSGRLFFLMGMDSFLDITSWHDSERLITLCDFATTFRPGYPHNDLAQHRYVREIDLFMLDMLDARERLLGKVELISGRRLWLVSSLGMDISSTEIRHRLKRRKSVKYLLPEPALSYIIENRLYI